MKTAISNIALPSFDHIKEIYQLHDIGFDGLEVAPSKIWDDVKKVKPKQVTQYRKQVETAGLRIIGMHSLFWDQPELGLFIDSITRQKTLDFLIHLSKICSDLGGSFLVLGSPQARRRNGISIDKANREIISFFSELSNYINNHGTCFVIEALGEDETDYIHTLIHALDIIKRVNKQELMSHVDAKAVFNANEANSEIFKKIKPILKHAHVNEPNLGILGETGKVNHGLFSSLLKEIGYQEYVTLEQRIVDQNDIIGPIRKSYQLMVKYYL